MRHLLASSLRRTVCAIVLGCLAGTVAAATFAAEDLVISQKSRRFEPGSVTLSKNQALEIFNDDNGLVHHAYVESEAFNFDSGDQNPGSRTRIVFSVPGNFQVLCGIHPKMKPDVHVM